MSYSGRASDEILKNLLSVLTEYQETVQEEREIERQRIDFLEAELNKQRDKNKQIAAILMRD